LGRNGRGCCASHQRLANLIGCSRPHLSKVIGDLELFGYLTTRINPRDHRLRAYSVVYNAEDVALFNSRGSHRKSDIGTLALTKLQESCTSQITEPRVRVLPNDLPFVQDAAAQERLSGLYEPKPNSAGLRRDLVSQGPFGCGARMRDKKPS
jgi:hypothetical protein